MWLSCRLPASTLLVRARQGSHLRAPVQAPASDVVSAARPFRGKSDTMWGPSTAILYAARQQGSYKKVFSVSATVTNSEDERLPSNGYTQAPSEDKTGGWLQHRSKLDVPGSGPGMDWIKELMDEHCIQGAVDFTPPAAGLTHKPRILVLYGSLREKSFSRFLALECARLLEVLGAEVRVFNPDGLPPRDPALENHPKVLELRGLTEWSEGHVWVSPEMHGTITGVFKNQIDWIPLNTGSVRPTQGRTAVVLQVNGGSQSFNAVNELRKLARWMRMPCSVNQSSVAKAWQEFDDDGRMKPSDFRDRVVDVIEEFHKFTLIMREHADFLVDRYSERKEKEEKGRLLTQAEKEASRQARSS